MTYKRALKISGAAAIFIAAAILFACVMFRAPAKSALMLPAPTLSPIEPSRGPLPSGRSNGLTLLDPLPPIPTLGPYPTPGAGAPSTGPAPDDFFE